MIHDYNLERTGRNAVKVVTVREWLESGDGNAGDDLLK